MKDTLGFIILLAAVFLGVAFIYSLSDDDEPVVFLIAGSRDRTQSITNPYHYTRNAYWNRDFYYDNRPHHHHYHYSNSDNTTVTDTGTSGGQSTDTGTGSTGSDSGTSTGGTGTGTTTV